MRIERGLAWLAAIALALPAGAQPVTPERVEALERRNEQLETSNADLLRRLEELEARDRERTRAESAAIDGSMGAVGDWARRLRISGSTNGGYYYGGDETAFQDLSFQVFDARFFLDGDLGREVVVGETPVLRNAGFTFELGLVRLGELQNENLETLVGESYVDLQGIGGQRWANAQVGRFQLPVGENYLRFSKGYKDNPFITNTVGGPWWWDEGVRVYGSLLDGRFGWVGSLTDGDTSFSDDPSRELQGSLKLWVRPNSWFYASVSALRSGELGSDDDRASGSLWLGETWARPVRSVGSIAPIVNGRAVADAPSRFGNTTFVGADVVLTHDKLGRLWLAGGHYELDSSGRGSLYDRELWYWVAEWTVDGDLVSPELKPFYLALRANGLGTFDDDRGYILDNRRREDIGYNADSLVVYSAGLGWHVTRWLTLRTEFSHQRTGLVRGVSASLQRQADPANLFGVELGAAF